MADLNELMEKIHANAVDKGFWDEPVQTGVSLMLIVSELAEALESDRKEKFAAWNTYDNESDVWSEHKLQQFIQEFEVGVKDTFEDEMADSLIRILDLCAYMKIDIAKHIELKMLYNSTREYKHGKKY